MIHREDRDSIAVLRVEHGRANALDLELVLALEQGFAALTAEHPPAAVVTGTGTMFSAGVDLFRLLDGGEAAAGEFLAALDRLLVAWFACPVPLVAAINGHAIAGGCVLAAACDHRVMASGKAKIGVTELLVGLPFPTAALAILRALLAPAALSELVFGAATMPAEDAVALGLVDRAVAPDQVLAESLARARHYATIPAATFAMTKRQLRRDALAAMRTNADAGRVRELWADPATRAHARAYVERTIGRR